MFYRAVLAGGTGQAVDLRWEFSERAGARWRAAGPATFRFWKLLSVRRPNWTSMTRVAIAIRYLAVLNFTALVLGMILLGGDALNGHVADGRHYLSWHGKLTEVSPATFRYSRLHTIASFVLLGFAALSALASKPGATEIKWINRLVLGCGVVIVGLSFLKYGA
jgi:hypothetical protein